MLSREEVEEILSAARELRNFEVKGPGTRTDSPLLEKVIRAALSMGNLRDGGHILLGIEDGRLAEMQPGLTEQQVASWMSIDDVARKFSEYADPPLQFDLEAMELSSGATVVLIDVREFVDIAHLCARQRDPTLRKGALYVRSRGVAETVQVSTSVEMREVLDLATEKALRRYLETSRRAGVDLDRGSREARNDDRFEQQRRRAFE